MPGRQRFQLNNPIVPRRRIPYRVMWRGSKHGIHQRLCLVVTRSSAHRRRSYRIQLTNLPASISKSLIIIHETPSHHPPPFRPPRLHAYSSGNCRRCGCASASVLDYAWHQQSLWCLTSHRFRAIAADGKHPPHAAQTQQRLD